MGILIMKRKWSPIWKLEESKFIDLVKTSKRKKDVLLYFGLKNKGGNSKTLQKRINQLKLETSHFLNCGNSSWLNRPPLTRENAIQYIEQKLQCRKNIKKYLIKYDIIPYECFVCKNNGLWNNKKLSLQLEHINGISDDNKIKNLCFLCPNCHSQTSTFSGKNRKKSPLV